MNGGRNITVLLEQVLSTYYIKIHFKRKDNKTESINNNKINIPAEFWIVIIHFFLL
jgi:hypothetical protein